MVVCTLGREPRAARSSSRLPWAVILPRLQRSPGWPGQPGTSKPGDVRRSEVPRAAGRGSFRWNLLINSELTAVLSGKNPSFHGSQPYRRGGNPGFQRSRRPGGGKNLSWHRSRRVRNVGNSGFQHFRRVRNAKNSSFHPSRRVGNGGNSGWHQSWRVRGGGNSGCQRPEVVKKRHFQPPDAPSPRPLPQVVEGEESKTTRGLPSPHGHARR